MVSVLLHMLMVCANSASTIFEFHGPISPVARKFESFSNMLHILYIEFACAEEGHTGLLLTMLLCMANPSTGAWLRTVLVCAPCSLL